MSKYWTSLQLSNQTIIGKSWQKDKPRLQPRSGTNLTSLSLKKRELKHAQRLLVRNHLHTSWPIRTLMWAAWSARLRARNATRLLCLERTMAVNFKVRKWSQLGIKQFHSRTFTRRRLHLPRSISRIKTTKNSYNNSSLRRKTQKLRYKTQKI